VRSRSGIYARLKMAGSTKWSKNPLPFLETDRVGLAKRGSRYVQLVFIGLVLACVAGKTDISHASGACPNEALRAGPSVSLPDCRAYEQVTPVDKSTAVQDLDVSGMQGTPAVDGERFVLMTLVPFGSTPMINGSLSVFYRTLAGWQIQSVPPSNLGSKVYTSPIFSPSLVQVGLTVQSLEEAPLGQTFQVGVTGNRYATVASTSKTGAHEDYISGATPNFAHVFLGSTDHTLLSPTPTGTVEGAHDLYEWSGGEECGSVTSVCSLVNVHNNGSPMGECGAKLQGLSEDGSRVIFQSPDPEARSSEPDCQQPLRLYMRVVETVEGQKESRIEEISEPNSGVVEHAGLQPVYFAGTSASGSKVFFVTATELTKDDENEPGAQLYEYNANAEAGSRLTRLTNSKTGPMGEGESTRGDDENIFVSTDGSKVYFLTQTESIYRYNTVSKDLRIVTSTQGTGTGGSAASRFNELTPDGDFFTFVTKLRSPEEYDQVYRYDDESGKVICVSCPPDGSQPTGDALFHTQAGILEAAAPTPMFTAISEDGSYIFFESTQSLVPNAVNVHGGSFENANTDVYEWHNGTISLISSPIDQRPQKLLGASADGSNAFFLTHAQLVPQDIDPSADIYDARVNGGFPTSTESAACLGDTCQSAPPTPVRPTLGTSVANGLGNLVPVSVTVKVVCAKGKVRRRGRCVKQRTRRVRRPARRPTGHRRGGSR
jgi:hypothetical protein